MRPGVRKSILTLIAVGVVAFAIVIVGPVVYRLMTNQGVKTGDLHVANVVPATTDRNGTWEVIGGAAGNTTSVGFTFDELLPGSQRTTSGSTNEVTGQFRVENNELVDGGLTVDMTTLTTDIERRDINVRMTIFSTDTFPEARFEVGHGETSEPGRGALYGTDLSSVPDDGGAVRLNIPGRLTIRGVTRDVIVPMDVVRSENYVLMGGTLPINRLDYDVRTPDFVAAKVDENGELNLRIVLRKVEG